MMKTIFSILLLSLAAATAAEAQSLEAFKQRLVEPDSGARVEIHEAPDAAAAFSAASRSAAEKRHSGWRINLYTSNGQNARFEAEEVKKSFEESFPGVSVDMVYDIPYFKVSAGRCVTSEEAIMLLERVRAKFPKAFLMRETLSAADLLEENPEAAAPQSPDGTDGGRSGGRTCRRDARRMKFEAFCNRLVSDSCVFRGWRAKAKRVGQQNEPRISVVKPLFGGDFRLFAFGRTGCTDVDA